MKKTIALLTVTLIIMLSVVVSKGGETGERIGMKEAIGIALDRVEGEVVRAELERGLYGIRIRTGKGEMKEVYVDAATGKVVEKKNITLDDAVAIATGKVPGKVVKIEFEKGAYEVKILAGDGSRAEVYVDAKSGEILKIEKKRRRR